MISSEKNSAGPTSLQAASMASKRSLVLCCSGRRSRCLCAFSIITIAASIMAPMAIAMPPRLMMLELMPSRRMAMKAIKMPTGSIKMATNALRTCIRNTTQTTATISDSSISVRLSVSMARLMSSERSYTVCTVTPSGRPGPISSILAFRLAITSSAFSP